MSLAAVVTMDASATSFSSRLPRPVNVAARSQATVARAQRSIAPMSKSTIASRLPLPIARSQATVARVQRQTAPSSKTPIAARLPLPTTRSQATVARVQRQTASISKTPIAARLTLTTTRSQATVARVQRQTAPISKTPIAARLTLPTARSQATVARVQRQTAPISKTPVAARLLRPTKTDTHSQATVAWVQRHTIPTSSPTGASLPPRPVVNARSQVTAARAQPPSSSSSPSRIPVRRSQNTVASTQPIAAMGGQVSAASLRQRLPSPTTSESSDRATCGSVESLASTTSSLSISDTSSTKSSQRSATSVDGLSSDMPPHRHKAAVNIRRRIRELSDNLSRLRQESAARILERQESRRARTATSSRGELPYCPARTGLWDDQGIPLRGQYGYNFPINGRGCDCHGWEQRSEHWIHPRDWAITPAEAPTVDEGRIRKVRFADDPVTSQVVFKRWQEATWGVAGGNSEDPAVVEDDDREIAIMDAQAIFF